MSLSLLRIVTRLSIGTQLPLLKRLPRPPVVPHQDDEPRDNRQVINFHTQCSVGRTDMIGVQLACQAARISSITGPCPHTLSKPIGYPPGLQHSQTSLKGVLLANMIDPHRSTVRQPGNCSTTLVSLGFSSYNPP